MATKDPFWRLSCEVLAQSERFAFEASAMECVRHLGFEGYKFCFLWRLRGRLYSLNMSSKGIVADAYAVGNITRHGDLDPVSIRLARAESPFVWDPKNSSDFAAQTLCDDARFAASAPVAPQSTRLRGSLCVFSNSGSITAFENLVRWGEDDLAHLARILFFRYFSDFSDVGAAALSKSEEVIFERLIDGMRVKEIALDLKKSPKTITNQIESAKARLGAKTTAEAVAIWMNGWLSLGATAEIEDCPTDRPDPFEPLNREEVRGVKEV